MSNQDHIPQETLILPVKEQNQLLSRPRLQTSTTQKH